MNVACSRRALLAVPAALFLATGLLTGGTATAQSPRTESPVEIASEIYRRAVRDKDSGDFSYPIDPRDRRRAFSKAILRLWAEAEARTPDGDQGPLSFDPVTNSQDSSQLRGFKVASDGIHGEMARVDVTMIWAAEDGASRPPSDLIVRYNFVLEDGHWKIDEIGSAVDGDAWSLREILAGP